MKQLSSSMNKEYDKKVKMLAESDKLDDDGDDSDSMEEHFKLWDKI